MCTGDWIYVFVCGAELAQYNHGRLEAGVADVAVDDKSALAECEEAEGAEQHH